MDNKQGLQSKLVDDAGHACVAVEGPEDEAYVYAYAFVVSFCPPCIAGEGLLVTVKS